MTLPVTRAGLPTATARGGTSLVTTAPAPTTAPRPSRTPLSTMALEPMNTSSSMTTGALGAGPLPDLSSGAGGWASVSSMRAPEPMRTRLPILTWFPASTLHPLIPTSSPISSSAPSPHAVRMTSWKTPIEFPLLLLCALNLSPIEIRAPGPYRLKEGRPYRRHPYLHLIPWEEHQYQAIGMDRR